MNTDQILNKASIIRYVENKYPEAKKEHKNKLVNILLDYKNHVDREEENFLRELHREQNQ
jgi:hypothetical protein